MLFKKHKKATISFSHATEGRGGNSRSVPLDEESLIDYIKMKYEKHGKLLIDYISNENEIIMTTVETKKYLDNEEELENIKEIIKDYIKGSAVTLTGYAVFVDNTLKGVFNSESSAELKKKTLFSRGYNQDEITIEEIEVGSFKDFK